jgi:hypothetical protein
MMSNKLLNSDDIKKIFAQIETPEYNPADDVMEKIRTHVPGRRPRRKLTIILASVFIVIMLAGAGGRVMLQRYIDADGNIGLREWRGPRFFNFAEGEEGLFRIEFFTGNTNILALVMNNGEVISSSQPRRITTDFDELQKYLDSEIFKLPQYIPDNYYFDEAIIQFFLDENFDLGDTELLVSEERFGNVYEKYYIPENLNNIERISIRFRHTDQVEEDFDRNYYIHYSMGLCLTETINNDISGWWENTEFETLDLPQFSRSVLSSTAHRGILTEYLFHGFNSVPVRTSYRFLLRKEKLGTVRYHISRSSYNGIDGFESELIRSEIIKMAESIK